MGNGVGFTRADGSKIAPMVAEEIQSFELGYKGKMNDNSPVPGCKCLL